MAYSSSSVNNKKKVSTNPFDAIMDELDNNEFKYDSNYTSKMSKNKKNKKSKKKDSKYTNNKQPRQIRSVFGKNANKNQNKKKSFIQKAKERGQKLFELQDKSEQMRDTAMEYNSLSKQLADKSWFG